MPRHKIIVAISDAALVSHSTTTRYLAGMGVRPRLAARIEKELVAFGFGHLVRKDGVS
jgi:hypothetical protein